MTLKALTPNLVDVLIIGGGPAGLACAAALARLLHSSIVFSSKVFRNAKVDHMHIVATWDHRDPAEFRDAYRNDLLAGYKTIFFEDVAVKRIVKGGREDGTSLFEAEDENGKVWRGRKVVLATGVNDQMLDIKGYEDCWAHSIFHCLFCHGYEQRASKSAGVLAIGSLANPPMTLFIARQALRLAGNVTIYTNGNNALVQEIEDAKTSSNTNPKSKSRANISIDNRNIIELLRNPDGEGLTMIFEDGEKREEAFLTHQPKTMMNGDFVKQLGIEMTAQGDAKVSVPFHETNIGGIFAAGDCSEQAKSVTSALYAGTITAAGIGAQIQAED